MLSLPGGDVTLAPDERVVWSGEPRPVPPLGAFRHHGHPAVLALGFVIVLAMTAAAIFLWTTGRMKAHFFMMLLGPAYPASTLVSAALARCARQYVVTTNRGFVSDPVMTWAFPLGGSRIEREGDTLVFRGVAPVACERPDALALALHEPMRAALSDLPDAGLALTELEPIVRDAPPGPTASLDWKARKHTGRNVFKVAVVLVALVFVAHAWLTRVLSVPVPATVTGSATGLATSVSAMYLGQFTPDEFKSAQTTIVAGATHYAIPGRPTHIYALTFTISNVTAHGCIGGVSASIQGTLGGASVSTQPEVVDATALPGETTTTRVLYESPSPVDAFSVTIGNDPAIRFVAPWHP